MNRVRLRTFIYLIYQNYGNEFAFTIFSLLITWVSVCSTDKVFCHRIKDLLVILTFFTLVLFIDHIYNQVKAKCMKWIIN